MPTINLAALVLPRVKLTDLLGGCAGKVLLLMMGLSAGAHGQLAELDAAQLARVYGQLAAIDTVATPMEVVADGITSRAILSGQALAQEGVVAPALMQLLPVNAAGISIELSVALSIASIIWTDTDGWQPR